MAKIVQLETLMLEKQRHLYAYTVKCWKHGEYVKKKSFKGLLTMAWLLCFSIEHSRCLKMTRRPTFVFICANKKNAAKWGRKENRITTFVVWFSLSLSLLRHFLLSSKHPLMFSSLLSSTGTDFLTLSLLMVQLCPPTIVWTHLTEPAPQHS